MYNNVYIDIEHYKSVLSLLGDCTDEVMFVFDMERNYCALSHSAKMLLGDDNTEFDNATALLKKMIHPADYNGVMMDVARVFSEQQEEHNYEYRWKGRNGKYIWINCRGKLVKGTSGKKYMVGRATEIGKPHKVDNVTGLYRKEMLEKRMEQLIKSETTDAFLMLAGIDGFENIIEKSGQEYADHVLFTLLQCIETAVDDNAEVFSMSGDVLGILYYTNGSEELLRKTAAEINKQIEKVLKSAKYTMYFSISVGAVKLNEDSEPQREIEKARFCLHQARNMGRGSLYIYEERDYRDHVRILEIEDELRWSIENNFAGFKLFYQPIIDCKSNGLMGAEALLRWESDKFGFMLPDDFIPLLEDSGLIIPLGHWTLKKAMKQCSLWQEYIKDFKVSVNVSYVQVKKQDFPDEMLQLIEDSNLSHEDVILELTESLEPGADNVMSEKFRDFNERKISMAMDDFGDGYSNLKFVKQMLFDIIKVDKGFIHDVTKNNSDYKLLKHMTEMAHELGMKICYEGVENQNELDAIIGLAPDFLQGYYFGGPEDPKTFQNKFLEKINEK